MVTLTLARSTRAEDRPAVVQMVQGFTRRLRTRLPSVVWLAVLEWHPGGHGWHVHLCISRFIPKALLAELWPHGFVDVRRITVKGDPHSLSAARRAGQYVAKYLTKRDDAGAPAHVRGEHRYLRPLGLTWTEVEAEGEFADLVALAWKHLGTVSWLWYSGTDETWRGPSTLCMRGG